jgi:hypothetical protein
VSQDKNANLKEVNNRGIMITSSLPPLHEMLKIPPEAGERGTKGVR